MVVLAVGVCSGEVAHGSLEYREDVRGKRQLDIFYVWSSLHGRLSSPVDSSKRAARVRRPLRLANSVGLIDAGYRGEATLRSRDMTYQTILIWRVPVGFQERVGAICLQHVLRFLRMSEERSWLRWTTLSRRITQSSAATASSIAYCSKSLDCQCVDHGFAGRTVTCGALSSK